MPHSTCEKLEQTMGGQCDQHGPMMMVLGRIEGKLDASVAAQERIEARVDKMAEIHEEKPVPQPQLPPKIEFSVGNTTHDTRSSTRQETKPTGGGDPLLIKMSLAAAVMAIAAWGGPPAWHFLAQFIK